MSILKKDCPICCEKVYSYKIISCAKCEFEVCHKCVVEYVKTLKTTDISCMNTSCKHLWDRSFICRSLPTSIVYGPLKKHREDMLLEREIATLPATSQMIPLMNDLDRLSDEIVDIKEQIKKFKTLLHDKEEEQYLFKRKIHVLKTDLEGTNTEGTNTEKTTKKEPVNQILCPCPAKDCRGFVFKNTSSCCTVCKIEICTKCHLIVDQDHKCNEEDVASVALIKKECKACPSCGVPSRKTEGCSQVWCLMCHKAWDWNTCKIDNGYVHATDYYNYIRANGLEIPPRGINECRREDPSMVLTQIAKKYRDLFTKEEENFLFRRWQISLEFNGFYHRPPTNISLIDLRIKYLNKEIDQIKWKRILHMRDKEFALTNELYALKQAYGRAMNDSIMNLCANKNEPLSILQENVKVIHKIHDMMIQEYHNIMQAFKSKRACPFV